MSKVFQANQLQDHIDVWKVIANDTVVSWLSEGICIPFVNVPECFELPNHRLNSEQIQFIDSEISKLLQGGAIRKVDFVPKCVSPIGCVPKKSGKSRIILDLRKVNESCSAPKFQNEDIRCAIQLLEENDLMVSLDISNGFLHIPVSSAHQTYLGMKWRGTYYTWLTLPFGLSASPYFFAKTLRPVIQHLRQQGLRVMTFVDDFLLCSSPELIEDQRDTLVNTLTDLGWQINLEKSHLNPQPCIPYLGYIIHSSGPEGPYIQVSPERIRKLRKDLRRALKAQCLTARALAKIAGQCVSMTLAIVPGKLMLRNIYRLLASRRSWSDHLHFDKGTISDLCWWIDVSEFLECPINSPQRDRRADVDRCIRLGVGGCVLRRDSSRLVESPAIPITIKLSRDDGSSSGHKIFQSNTTWKEGTSHVGQCHNSGIHKPFGRTLQGPIPTSNCHLGRSGRTPNKSYRKTLGRENQCGGRLVIPLNSPVQMATSSSTLSDVRSSMGTPFHRSVCLDGKRSAARLQQLST